MEGTSLLSLPEGMLIEQIQITENGLVIALVATHPTSGCPLCSEPSSSIHSHYRRVLRDAPCAGRRVQLVLTIRKFYCRNPYCERRVFTERLPTFVERMPRGRRSGTVSRSLLSGWRPVAREEPDWLPGWAATPRARRSCAASWLSPICPPLPSSTLASTILRSGAAASSARS